MGPPSIPSRLFTMNPGEGSSGGGGQSAGGNSGPSTNITPQDTSVKHDTNIQLGVVIPSVELDDAKLDDLFGKPNQDHLKRARDKVVGQLNEMKGKTKMSIYGNYSRHLVLDDQDYHAIARQLLGLRKSYAMRFNKSMDSTKVMIPSPNGKNNIAVACTQATVNDLNSGINE